VKRGDASSSRYAVAMHSELEASRARPPILKRVFAAAVLVVAIALALKVAIGLVMAVFWTVVAIAVVIAILWALKTLLW